MTQRERTLISGWSLRPNALSPQPTQNNVRNWGPHIQMPQTMEKMFSNHHKCHPFMSEQQCLMLTGMGDILLSNGLVSERLVGKNKVFREKLKDTLEANSG